MLYADVTLEGEDVMEQSPMLSVPVTGGRQMEPLNWYFIAAACPVAVIVLYLGGILPPSSLVLLFIYCLLIAQHPS